MDNDKIKRENNVDTRENNTSTYDKLNDNIKIISVPVHLSQEMSKKYGEKNKIDLLILKNETANTEIVLGELPTVKSSDNALDSLKKLCSTESLQLARLADKDIAPEYKLKLINGSLNKISAICDVEIGLKYTQEGYDLFHGNDEYSKADAVFTTQQTVKRNLDTFNMENPKGSYEDIFRSKDEWDKTISLNSGRDKVRYTKDELLELKNEKLTRENVRNFVAANRKGIDKYIDANEDIKEAFDNTAQENRNIFYAGVVDRMLQEKITELENKTKEKDNALKQDVFK